MTITLLDCVKSAAYQIAQPAPSALVSATDQVSLQWLHLLYALGRSICLQYDYPTMIKQYRFSTVVGNANYPLPGNFLRPVLGAQWDESNSWPLLGAVSGSEVAARNVGVEPYGAEYSWRVLGAIQQQVGQASFDGNGGYFEASPTPTAVRDLYLEYVSSNWFYPKQWAASESLSSGDLRSANGEIYKATSTGTTNSTRPSGESTTTGATGVSFQLWRDKYDKMGADTDYPIIDPEVVIAGLKARWKQAKGLDSSAEQSEFISVLRASVSRFDGSTQISADGPDTIQMPNLSDGFISTGW